MHSLCQVFIHSFLCLHIFFSFLLYFSVLFLFRLLLRSAVLFSATPCWLSSRACKSVFIVCTLGHYLSLNLFGCLFSHFVSRVFCLCSAVSQTLKFRYFDSFLMFLQTCITFYGGQSSASVQPSKSFASSFSRTSCPVS